MPELPEVEVLARHLAPLLRGRTIRAVRVRRARVIRPTSPRRLQQALVGATFAGLSRRGKYLLFSLHKGKLRAPILLVGHLGMTGRMYLLPARALLPKHAAIVLELGRDKFVFEDTRYFGRLTLRADAVSGLGPEPLSPEFTGEALAERLKGSRQAIKVKLLDQTVVAGLGNIYASEALFRAGIWPRLPGGKITGAQAERLHAKICEVLIEAIARGSTLSLDYAGTAGRDGLFYFGQTAPATELHSERLLVYDRAGRECVNCGTVIRRFVQAGRSTFFCPHCQRR